ncbi:MAG: transposase [Chromatiaceae bacterium]|nr:MAG: transposase [Chromatiaceae bacterium]
MPTIQRSYKLRIYPTAVQAQRLACDFGCARWVWNTCLAWRSNLYRAEGESVTGVDFSRELTFLKRLPGYEWLADAPATILTQKLRDQDQAFANFFAGRAKFPRLKKKGHAQSIRYQLDQRIVAGLYRPGELLKVPKLGALKVRWSRVPAGIPKLVTISRDAAGRYFAAFMVEEEVQPLPEKPNGVGVDLGVKDLAITSDGARFGNARPLQRLLRRLKHAQRVLSRRRKGSGNWHRQRQRSARLHVRIADLRRELTHQASHAIVTGAGLIAIEDLHVKGMCASAKGTLEQPGRRVRQKAGLNRAILDAALGEVRRQIAYKAEWNGRVLVVVDRWAPSSKTCSHCGHVLGALPLSVRAWSCPNCGTAHDRDVNAARNLLAWATGGGAGTRNDACGAVTIPEALTA